MNGSMLAKEMLVAVGGKVTPQRLKAFEKMADAIVKHIQLNAVVTVITSPPAPGLPGTGAGAKVTGTGIL
jgi:hypothetical protein